MPALGMSLWTGRLEFDVADAVGSVVGRVEIVVRVDSVTFWWGSRTLSVIHREDLRLLLRSADSRLSQDDLVIWWSAAGELLIQIEDWGPLVLPVGIVVALRQGV